ncbi:peptidase M23 [Aliidiomarina taiwanensis]|uniref:Peptidase M23 n=1 Tax=Aliidiomarina taiwanensis TaxID=946228 RepID=A0A432X770_9GAMM|nr:peptidoglycan DD-metalloendopeptidase family protein [Aliidiomarina taiwanensis]RUO42695.1 peptidase M23 [Aliidiomarina taiwanensis]
MVPLGRILALFAFLFCMAAPSAFAMQNDAREQHAEAERQLRELQQNIQQQRRLFDRNQQRLSQSERALRDLEREMASSTQALQRTEQALAGLRARIRELEAEQRTLQDSLQTQAQLLADQIDAAYRAGDYSFLQLLLNQENPARFERMLEYFRHLNEARLAQLEQLHATEVELKEVQAQLEQQQSQLAQRRAEQAEQRNQIEQQRQRQEQRVAELQQAQASASASLQAMQQNEQEVTALIASLADVLRSTNIQLAGLGNLRGSLPWPLKGRIRHRFGEQRSSQVNWRGLVIEAEAEQPVHSIADGRVLFADWLRGFGLVMVLDHGDGYMSLYGYNQALMFDVGQAVRKGQVISLAGQSGGQREPGLYFEIRHRGDPVNPLRFLQR